MAMSEQQNPSPAEEQDEPLASDQLAPVSGAGLASSPLGVKRNTVGVVSDTPIGTPDI